MKDTLRQVDARLGLVKEERQKRLFDEDEVVAPDPYEGGVEWMLCFPDVLDEDGRFIDGTKYITLSAYPIIQNCRYSLTA